MKSISYKDLVEGFKSISIPKGTTLLVHSSMKSFGCHIEGGPMTVIDALREVCGDDGNIVMPTLSFSSIDEDNPFFDVRNTPSDCGIITEVFRQLPYAYRSVHVVSSAAVIGDKAEYITQYHHDTPCGPGSPYQKIIELDGHVLFIGATFGSNTLFHVAEEYVDPPYMCYKAIEDVVVKDAKGDTFTHTFTRYNCAQTGIRRILARMEPIFYEKRVIKETQIGQARIMLISAVDNFEISSKVLKQNPNLILET